MCLVAFQKIFRKIFSGVWKRRRKTQIQKNTSHNPEKNHQRRQIQSDNRVVDRDLAFFARSRSTASRDRDLREITIDGAISRSVDRNLDLREIAMLIAISDRDRWRGRRTVFSVVVDDFFLGCGLCFLGFVFSFFFSKHQKIFFGKFFEMQPNTMETFSSSGN